MQIPRKFKLMGMDWRVVLQPPMKDGNEQFGYTEFSSQTIAISPNISDPAQEQTFIHELLHAIIYSMGISKSCELTDALEEKLVESVSNGLYAFIKDNPKCLSNSVRSSR